MLGHMGSPRPEGPKLPHTSQTHPHKIESGRDWIFRVTPDKKWDQAQGDQGTSDTCIKSANKCQGTTPLFRKCPILNHSEMLAPLTGQVGECGQQTKEIKAKGTKKVPWHWDGIHQQAFNVVKATIVKIVVLAYLWSVHWCFVYPTGLSYHSIK